MRRLAPAVLLVALATCSAPRAPAPTAETAAPAPGRCRIGPDGGPLAGAPATRVAERGIGGTGAPAGAPVGAPAGPLLAERGIGGTGARVAERGIGGTGAPATGILGVITGFASVCLAGEEVQYAADTPVEIDGRPARPDDLRAGQVAAIAAGAEPSPYALRVTVRHEVSGPVEGMEPGGTLRVAGQPVLPPPGAVPPAPGTWVAVSGFRRGDGTVVATRLDPRPPGEVLIRGTMVATGGRFWIGTTEVRPGSGQFRRPGVPVLAIGRLATSRPDGAVLDADTVEPDALLLDPNAYFGTPGALVVQGYAEDGFVLFGGRRYDAPFRPGFATLRLQRNGAGQFDPVSVRPFGPERPFAAPRAGLQPAPVPNRGFGRASDAPRSGGGFRRRDAREGGDNGEQGPRGGFGGSGPGGGSGGGPGGGLGGFGGGRGR